MQRFICTFSSTCCHCYINLSQRESGDEPNSFFAGSTSYESFGKKTLSAAKALVAFPKQTLDGWIPLSKAHAHQVVLCNRHKRDLLFPSPGLPIPQIRLCCSYRASFAAEAPANASPLDWRVLLEVFQVPWTLIKCRFQWAVCPQSHECCFSGSTLTLCRVYPEPGILAIVPSLAPEQMALTRLPQSWGFWMMDVFQPGAISWRICPRAGHAGSHLQLLSEISILIN